jgi:hypothetical protein
MVTGASRRSLILRTTYAACLAVATPVHVLFDVRYGLLLSGLEPLPGVAGALASNSMNSLINDTFLRSHFAAFDSPTTLVR